MKKRLVLKKYLDDEKVYYIQNKKREKLGEIYFYDDWKKWVFESEQGIIFTWDCLIELSKFVNEVRNKHKG